MDKIFGVDHFQNEISWKRTTTKNDYQQGATNWPRIRDVLLHYRKGEVRDVTFHQPFTSYSDEYVSKKYNHHDAEGRAYMLDNLTAPGAGSRGHPQYEFMGVIRYWRYNKEKMQALFDEGRVVQPSPGAVPRYKRYLDEMKGIAIGDTWDDIPPINSMAEERMGYPTQKPLALLERIISASSNPGDVVFDPFCGCGTAVVGAEKLGRRWIGIDITYIALDLMIARLLKDFGLQRGKEYDVLGDPKDEYSARKLFEESPKQFEIWAVGLVAGVPQPEKSGDKGVDGKVYFMDLAGKLQWAVAQVKGGHLTPSMVRDFETVIQNNKAAMGFFICLDCPTKGMQTEAEELGFFDSPSGRKIPKLQVRTIKELLEGKEFDFPKGYSLRSSGKKLLREGEQTDLGL
jgi:site-specific DNA-methyltransferase (adenine-specific)